jgi:pimeloyl-ACP methyl ester carboxylesterase
MRTSEGHGRIARVRQPRASERFGGPGAACRGRTILALSAVVAVCLAGCGSASSAGHADPVQRGKRSPKPEPKSLIKYGAAPIKGIKEEAVGQGPAGAVILSRPGARRRSPVVVFLHGWILGSPIYYQSWMRHLTARGHLVIFPTYEGPTTRPEEAFGNAIKGLRAALRTLGRKPGKLAVVGITTGGAIAVDYAARAKNLGLPEPAGVMSIYPARDTGDGVIQSADLSRIPATTRLAVISGPNDPVHGGLALAKATAREAKRIPRSRRRHLTASDPAPDGPTRGDNAARHSFWAPLDELLSELGT